jgi:hypothetical protein
MLQEAASMKDLPVWFLLLSLALPRIALLIAYFHHDLAPSILHGWMPPTLAVLIPRVLVIILIFQDRGFSGWLLVHSIFLMCAYLSGGKQHGQRRPAQST